MLDRLDGMVAFVAVCDGRGFAAAARRLHLSPSVVTRRVAALEERMGVRLLQRTTRSIMLTEAGARFLERARRILAEVEEAELSAQDERTHPRGKLAVSAPLLFGRMHVAPLLSRFLATFAEVSAELMLTDRLVNLVEEGVDVAIRIGSLPDSSLIATKLGQTRRVLAAAPAYLVEKGGMPEHPRELARYDIISFDALLPDTEWVFIGAGGDEIRVRIKPRLTTNNGDVAIDHALSGGGITAAFCYQVDQGFRSGALVEVLPAFAPPPVPIQAVFPTSRLLSSKVKAFLTLAKEAASSWRFLDHSAGKADA
jgi:DNA-binding transcriptional LysR family regulator